MCIRDRNPMIATATPNLEVFLTTEEAEAVIGAVRHAADHDTPLRTELLSCLGALYVAFDPLCATVELDVAQIDATVLAVRHGIDHQPPNSSLLTASLRALYE